MESLGIRSPRERWFSHFAGSFKVSKNEVSAPEPPPPVKETVDLSAAPPPDQKSGLRRLYQTIGGSILLALTVAGIGNWVGPHCVPVTPRPTETVQVAPAPVVKPAPLQVAPPAAPGVAAQPKVVPVVHPAAHHAAPHHHATHHHAAAHHHGTAAHHQPAAPSFKPTAPIVVAPVMPDLTPPTIDLGPLDPIPDLHLSWQAPVVLAPPAEAPAPAVSAEVKTDTAAPTLGVTVPQGDSTKANTALEVGSVIPLAGTAVETVTAINAGNAALSLAGQAESLAAQAQAAAAAGNLQQAAALGSQAQHDGALASALGSKAQAAANVAKVTSIVGGSIAVVDGGIDIGTGAHEIHQANRLTRAVDADVHSLADQGQLTPDLAHQADQARHGLHHLKVKGEHRVERGGAKVVFGGMMIASPFTGPAAPIVGGVGAVGYLGTSVAGHIHPVKAVKAIGHIFHHHHAPQAVDAELMPGGALPADADLMPGGALPAAPAPDQTVVHSADGDLNVGQMPSAGDQQFDPGLEILKVAPLTGAAVESVTAINLGNQAMAMGAEASSLGQAAQTAAMAGNLGQAQVLGSEAQQLGAKASIVGSHAQAAANIAKPLTIVSGGIAVVDGGIDIGTGLHTVHQANKLQHSVDDQVISLAEQGQLTPATVGQYDQVTQDIHHAKVAGEHRAERGGAKVVFGGMMIASPFTGPAAPIVGGVGAVGYLGTTLAGHVHPVKAVKSVIHHIGHIFHHNPKTSADLGKATSVVVPKTGASVMDRFLANHCAPDNG
ncbi:MAG TPA: hypothetical protein VGO93_25065 [Candidatus Xenobia bacterium]